MPRKDVQNINGKQKNSQLPLTHELDKNNEQPQEIKEQNIQKPNSTVSFIEQLNNAPSGSILSDDYLNAGKNKIPGMNNGSSQALSNPDVRERTNEEILNERLSFLESTLNGYQRVRGGSAEDIRLRQRSIERTKNEIEDIKIKLGLISPEELEEKRIAAQLEEKERNKLDLQRYEKQLATYLEAPDIGSEADKQWRKNQISGLKKGIERLYALVPPDERLPVNDEEQQLDNSQEIAEPQEPAVPAQIQNQKPQAVNKAPSWLDEDDEPVREGEQNSGAKEVEDPMADLRAAWNSGEPAKIEDRKGLGKDEEQNLRDKKRNIVAQTVQKMSEEEKKALSEINERILSSFPEDKVFTEEETNLINERVANALQDEKEEHEEQIEVAMHQGVALPNVELFEAEQQRSEPSKKSLSWLDEDDEPVREGKLNSGAEEVEDPMADLRAAWNRGETAKIQGSEEHKRNEQQNILDKAWNLIAQTGENISKTEKEALSKINERILSSLPEERVITDEETKAIDEMVARALADEKEEQQKAQSKKNSVSQSNELPDVDIEEDEPVNQILNQEEPKKDEPDQSVQNDSGKRLLYGFDEVGEKEKDSQNLGENLDDNAMLDTPRIRDFYNRLDKRMKNDTVEKLVKAELTEIIKEAGITSPDKAFEIVEASYFDIKETIGILYDPKTVIDTKMTTDAPIFFHNAFLSLKNTELSEKDRIITAQKFADVMIKNYSPVAFVDKALDRFADNYVLNNRELLGEQLLNLGYNNLEADKLTKEIFGVPEKEQPEQDKAPNENLGPQPLHIPDFKQWLNGQIANANIHQQVRTELTDIIKSASVTDQNTLSRLVELSHNLLPKTITSSPLLDVENLDMPSIALQFFADSYNTLAWAELNPKERVITAQKIANLMLKNYSPVAFVDLKLDQYADNYVVNNRELLESHLETKGIDRDKIASLIDEVQSTLAIVPQNEQREPEKNHISQQQPESPKQEGAQQSQPINFEARVTVFTDKLKAYNNMYKLDVDSNRIAASVTEAWELMTSSDKQKMADGKKVLNDLFKDTLKKAFDVEKGVAYDEHRLPEYAEIIKSTNELIRSAMYGFTDMYHNPNRKDLFSTTAFGGLNGKDMVELTVGQSLWSMDQKSDEAWDIQSKEAKNIAEKWMKEDKPHEKMISEMKLLIKSNEEGIIPRKEMIDKLTAAEWLLENDDKMMIEDPYDPYNKIPNWGNRYWKALIETRETLGIDKHTSMRDMIQADYAASAKAVNNPTYNLTQIKYYVLDEDVRGLADCREDQMEQFAIQSAAVKLTEPKENKEPNDDMTQTRIRQPVEQLNQRSIMKNEPKNHNWIIDEAAHRELTILGQSN